MIQKHTIRVAGRVQGVFFRQSTKEKADQLGLTGLVRNEPDGSVFIEVEGTAENLKKFIAWCHAGPEYAKVEKVEISEVKEPHGFENFKIEVYNILVKHNHRGIYPRG